MRPVDYIDTFYITDEFLRIEETVKDTELIIKSLNTAKTYGQNKRKSYKNKQRKNKRSKK